MIILWDEPKRLTNLKKHGLDFADLDSGFADRYFVISARGDRKMAIGNLRGETVAVIFRRVGSEAISIISLRRASRHERLYL